VKINKTSWTCENFKYQSRISSVMEKRTKTVVIFPAKNEEDTIEHVVITAKKKPLRSGSNSGRRILIRQDGQQGPERRSNSN
jgi:hypothetical protein